MYLEIDMGGPNITSLSVIVDHCQTVMGQI